MKWNLVCKIFNSAILWINIFFACTPPKRPKIDCVQFAILSPQIYNVKNVCKTRSPQGEHFERICVHFLLIAETAEYYLLGMHPRGF